MLQIWRMFNAGTHNFLRNLWLSTAATAVMTITLTIVLISFISNSALTNTIKGVTDKIDISVFLIDGITPDQLALVQSKLTADPNVSSVHHVTKTDALNQWRRDHAGDQKLLDAASEADNPLPASFQVKTKDAKKLNTLTAIINQPDVKPLLDHKDPISYTGNNKATIDKIVRVSNFIKTTGLIASIIFVVISTLIIFNTIRMAIFTRRDEIEIMKLVGATRWFIRGPFLFEAALYGVIAALVSAGLAFALLFAGAPKVSGYIDVSSAMSLFGTYPLLVVGSAMLIGVVIGMFSSLLAMSRYLKL